MSRTLIIIGVLLVALGLAWPFLVKLPLGRLPGDITIRRDGFQFFFPITTCIVVSILLTLLFRIFRK